MDFETLYASLPGTGWLTKPEAELLLRWRDLTSGPILEVGSYHGKATCLLASGERYVKCVDPFAGFDDSDPDGSKTKAAFFANIEARGLTEYVHLLAVRVEQAYITGKYGLCYLDGDHTYPGTLAQIAVAKRLSPDVIAVHDVNDSGGGAEVKRACLHQLGLWTERVGRLAVWYVAP